MSKSASLIYCEHPASEYDRQKFKRAIEFTQARFTYKRIKGGYQCYCSRCGQHFTLNDEQLEQVKEAELCFHCAFSVKVLQKRPRKIYPKWTWLAICNEKGAINGYNVVWQGDEDIEILSAEHVLHYGNDGSQYLYGVTKNMGYSLTRNNNKNYWRKERWSYNSYLNYFYNVDEILAEEWKRKKGYYLGLNLELKSNQATFVKKGIYNENQLDYIRMFDLNHPEDLHKYKEYISRHHVPYNGRERKFSINTLDYLVRNNFSIGEYVDYVRTCETLGMNWEKPKDLYAKHNELLKIINAKKNEVYAQNVVKRHDQLAKNEWQKGSLAIHVVHDFQEMQKISTELKTCISRLYVKPYSTGTTDVYYGTTEGNTTFALEIANRKLQQLRGPCNTDVNDDVKKFVGEWCKRLGYQC